MYPAPSRIALVLRAALILAVAVLFMIVLVRNGSDNAYIFFPLAGFALSVLAVPFVVAALLPAQARRVVAPFAVGAVRAVGGCGVAVLLVSLIPAATQYRTPDVLISHLAGLLLLVPLVVGIDWRLQ